MQRITYPAACVLWALDSGNSYGFSIMDATDLASGTVYQMLRRFEREGLVRSRWEKSRAPANEGRPRRRYYQITRQGKAALSRATERYHRHLAALDQLETP